MRRVTEDEVRELLLMELANEFDTGPVWNPQFDPAKEEGPDNPILFESPLDRVPIMRRVFLGDTRSEVVFSGELVDLILPQVMAMIRFGS